MNKNTKSTRSLRQKWKSSEYLMQAYDSRNQENHSTLVDLAINGLDDGPDAEKLYSLGLEAAVKLNDTYRSYLLLKRAWECKLLIHKHNYCVLGQLANKYEDYKLAEQVLHVLLYNRKGLQGRLTREKQVSAEFYLSFAREKLGIFPSTVNKEQSKQTSTQKKNKKTSQTRKASEKTKQNKKEPADQNKQGQASLQQSGSVQKEQVLEASGPLPSLEINFNFDLQDVQTALQNQETSTSQALNIALWAYRLSFRSSYDQLLCLSLLPNVQSFWFQEETARKVMKGLRGRALLADEVGLGKTIEASLVLKEYIMRGLVRNALILVPSSLVGQWKEELQSKFNLNFCTSNDALFRTDPKAFWQQPYILLSLQTARSKHNFETVTARNYDIVIADEAHHFKNRNTRNWQLLNSIQKNYLLMLTATPVQNKLEELYNLITLLKPGHLSTVTAFKNEFVAKGDPTDPRNRGKLRQLLKEVMVRNTRSVAQVRLPPRFAHTVRVEPFTEEEEFYALISDLVTSWSRQESKSVSKMALRKLLQAAGSSHYAALKNLKNMQEQYPAQIGDQIEPIINKGEKIRTSSKSEQVLELLKASSEQKIVFVNSQATLEYLQQVFTEHKLSHLVLKGSLTSQKKKETIDQFAQGLPLLLSMDSGGEGHNLQFCHQIINYDLPWNPMQIEQRIGRIHRIGQENEVYIYNFCASGSLEDKILDILDRKINMFELVIGEMEMILGRMQGEQEFSELIYKLWADNPDSDSREKAFEKLGSNLKRAQTAHEKSKDLDDKLFQEDFGV